MSAVLGAIGAGLQGMSTLGSFFAARDQTSEARRQFDESMRFQRYQYDDMKRYNSPENQARLMRKAGFNPALMASNLGQSTAVGVGSPSPTASSALPDFSGLSSAGDLLSRLGLISSEEQVNKSSADVNTATANNFAARTTQQLIDNLYRDEWNKSTLYNLNSGSWLADKQAELVGSNVEFNVRSMRDRLSQQFFQSALTKANLDSQIIANTYMPEQFAQQIASLITNQKVALMTGHATVKSAMAAVMSAVNEMNKNNALFGDNDAKRGQFFSATLDGMKAANELSRSQTFKNIADPNTLGYGTFYDDSHYRFWQRDNSDKVSFPYRERHIRDSKFPWQR